MEISNDVLLTTTVPFFFDETTLTLTEGIDAGVYDYDITGNLLTLTLVTGGNSMILTRI
jgi:hypothetical protein